MSKRDLSTSSIVHQFADQTAKRLASRVIKARNTSPAAASLE